MTRNSNEEHRKTFVELHNEFHNNSTWLKQICSKYSDKQHLSKCPNKIIKSKTTIENWTQQTHKKIFRNEKLTAIKWKHRKIMR